MSLTPEQQAAVTRWRQDVCVVAGPGSGKTRVLVERYLWLLDQHQFTPDQILVITFTEKAAQELKERLTHRVAEDPVRRATLERAPITTIHGYGARLLRRYAVAAGLDPAFRILDERAAHLELTAAIHGELDRWAIDRASDLRLLLAAWNTHDPVGDLAALYDTWRTSGGTLADLRTAPPSPANEHAELLTAADQAIRLARAKMSKAISDRLPALIDWTELLRQTHPRDSDAWLRLLASFQFSLSGLHAHPVNPAIKDLRARLDAATVHAVARAAGPARRLLVAIFAAAVEAYERRKEAISGVDFGDLETRAIALLERHDAIREYVQSEFESILMDELQDTNPLQWRLVNLLRRPGRFFAVGDINQSIFGFRHADPAGFRQYRDSLAAQGHAIDRLTGNFRSRAEILAAVTAIVDLAAGIEAPQLEAQRALDPPLAPPVEAQLILEDDREIRSAREADWMARRIRELVREGASYGDIAVLFRSTTELAEFERAFRSFEIPFVLARGQRFFEQQEIADLLNWLRVLDNPRHEFALAAVLRSPLAGVSDAELLTWRDRHGRLSAALPDELPNLQHWLDAERRASISRPPDQLLAAVLDRSGYERTLDSRGLNNVDKLLTLVRDWWNEEPRPLPHLIRYLEDLRALSDEPNAPAFGESNAVRVLTVHASKGLEFPIVFLGSLQRKGDSRPPSLSFSRLRGLGVDWRDPISGAGVADPLHRQNNEDRAAAETEEANRLLYVAMTRAESRLIFSTTDGMRAWAAPVLRVVRPRELTGAPPRWDLLSVAAPGTPQLSFAFDPRDTASARVEWISPTAPAAAAPSSLSVTDLLAFTAGDLARPFVAAPTSDRDDPTEIGRQTHWLLEHGPTAPIPPSFDPESALLAARFWSSRLHQRAVDAPRQEREFDFQIDCEGLMLSGQIDLWFEESDGRLVIVDYKTDRLRADDVPARAAHYALQLTVYATALERLAGRAPDEMYLYFLELDRAVPVRADGTLMRDSIRRWRDSLAAPASSSRAPQATGTAPYPAPPSLPVPDRS